MLAAANNSIFVNLNFIGDSEGNYFVSYANLQAGEIICSAFRPFEIDVFERRVLAREATVHLD